jgi:hypothetical protein
MPAGNVFVLEAGAEEVADGDFDAGFRVAVPVHAQDELAQVVRRRRVDGDPDVADGAGACDVGQRRGFACFDADGIHIAAGVIVAGGAVGRDLGAQCGDIRQWPRFLAAKAGGRK